MYHVTHSTVVSDRGALGFTSRASRRWQKIAERDGSISVSVRYKHCGIPHETNVETMFIPV